jgi:Rod binding domain-containing protein
MDVQAIDQSLLPADVRKGGAKAQQLYEAALGFERELVAQLTQGLTDTTQADDGSSSDGSDGSDGTDAVTQLYQDMLPGTLADSIQASGGLGLAQQLYSSLGSGQ